MHPICFLLHEESERLLYEDQNRELQGIDMGEEIEGFIQLIGIVPQASRTLDAEEGILEESQPGREANYEMLYDDEDIIPDIFDLEYMDVVGGEAVQALVDIGESELTEE